MRKTILIFAFLSAVMLLNGSIKRIGLPGNYRFFNDSTQIFGEEIDGEVIAKWDSTAVFGRYNYSKGSLNGKQTEYFEDGKTVSAEWEMTNGIRTGSGKEYYEDGTVKFSRDLDKKGNGIGTEFYKNGMKMRERLYVNGKQVHVSFYNHDIKGTRYERNAEELFAEAQEYGQLGMYGHANGDYMEFLKKYPDNPRCDEAKFLIAFNYHNYLDEIDLARKHYSEFIERFPDSPLSFSAKFELENLGKDIDDIDIFNE